jgi:hypothetical protein
VQTVHGSYSDEVRPSIEIQAEFGAAGTRSKLEGGQGTVWRAGDVTLKPVDVLPEELLWLDEVARKHSVGGGLRLSLPIRSRSEKLIVDGWTAFPYLTGEHQPGKWSELAIIAHQFAALFSDVERPAFIDMRSHAWARADRFAWGEDDGGLPIAGRCGCPWGSDGPTVALGFQVPSRRHCCGQDVPASRSPGCARAGAPRMSHGWRSVGVRQVEAVPLDHTMFDFQSGEPGMEFKRHGALPDT